MLEPIQVIQLFMTSPHMLEVKAGEVSFETGASGDVMFGIVEGTVDLKVIRSLSTHLRAFKAMSRG